MIAAWLVGSGERLESAEVAKLREELQWALIPFQNGRDEEVIESSRPLMELLELGVAIDRPMVHALLAELVLDISAGYHRMAAGMDRAGFGDAAQLAREYALELTASATLHAQQGAGAQEGCA